MYPIGQHFKYLEIAKKMRKGMAVIWPPAFIIYPPIVTKGHGYINWTPYFLIFTFILAKFSITFQLIYYPVPDSFD